MNNETNVKVSSIETISVDANGNVLPVSVEYNEYKNDLIKIYSTTTENNSLYSEFIINNDSCSHKLIVNFSNGVKSLEKDTNFVYDDNFKNNFLIPMLEDYNKFNSISSDDVTLDGDKAIFKANTKDNDCLIIKKIDIEFASQLSDIVFKSDTLNKNLTDSIEIKQRINERGIGNYLIIILTIVLILLTLIGTLFFTIMVNK